LLRSEQLEPRTVLSSASVLGNLHAQVLGHGLPGTYAKATANTAPAVAKAASLVTAGNVTGKSASVTVLGSDDGGAANLVYNWKVVSAPQGGSASFSVNGTNAARTDTITFTAAGTYGLLVTIVDAGGLSTSSSLQITVAPTLTTIGVFPTGAKTAIGSSTLKVAGSSVALSAVGCDQFGNVLAAQPSFTWATTNASGGAAPTLTGKGGNVTLNFSRAGTYTESVAANTASGAKVSALVSLNVVQTLTRITVTPGTASLSAGGTQQFQAQGFDQFQKAMASQPGFTWTASGGSITSSGLFTAQNSAATDTITAKSGVVGGTAKVTVSAPAPSPTPSPSPSPGPGPSFQDTTLGKLIATLDADGSLGRSDIMQILASVASGGTISAADYADLKTILANASFYNMPDYVKVLAGDVVNGNAANAAYQGASLGNLAAGSSSAQLTKLVDKWFLGSDHPVLTSSSLTYATASGSLFPVTPSHNDEFQGQLGDCYFISTLGTIADQNPQAVKNMFIDNGDGTFTVRFYTGSYGAFYNADGTVSDGFTSGTGTADYVTVDRSVVVYANSGGVMAYSDYGQSASNASNALWIPFAEKAYAQWNQTGKEGRDGTNKYGSIEGGWMATVDAQVLGRNATDYNVVNSTKQAMINALAGHKSVTIGTISSSASDDSLPGGLYGSHAYAVIGYNASADLFTLYNPWGMDQPGVLSWSQLESTTDGFVVADPSGSTPIAGGNLHSPASAAWLNGSAAAAGGSNSANNSNTVLSPAAVDAVFASRA
jgi:hypothetical protein